MPYNYKHYLIPYYTSFTLLSFSAHSRRSSIAFDLGYMGIRVRGGLPIKKGAGSP